MSENFATEEKQLIEKFINSLKEDLNNPEILIEYDVTEHGKYIGSEYEIPRGNAASESWSDRMLSDTFKISDVAFYKVIFKGKRIGQIDFAKYFCSKILGENISTINVTDTFPGDFFHIHEFYPGIGLQIRTKNSNDIDQFFNDKKNNLLNVINNQL
jgi:hypothetical protein